MASASPRTTRFRDKRTGKAYWVEYRTGFRGREFNFGGGWRISLDAAFKAAEASAALSEVQGN
jgi:hypothetical protein